MTNNNQGCCPCKAFSNDCTIEVNGIDCTCECHATPENKYCPHGFEPDTCKVCAPEPREGEWETTQDKIETIINRHSPMPNFEIKEACAEEIVMEVVKPLLTSHEANILRETTKELSEKIGDIMAEFGDQPEACLSIIYEQLNGGKEVVY